MNFIKTFLLVFLISVTPSTLFAKDWSQQSNADVGHDGNLVASNFEFRAAEIGLGDSEPKYIMSTLKSLDDLQKYGYNIVTINIYCGLTTAGIVSRYKSESKQKRLIDGLVNGCYLPKYRTRYKKNSKWHAKDVNALELYAEYAHQLGLKFNLKPMVLRHTDTYGLNGMSKQTFWRGDSEFAAYDKMILDLASLAETLRIEYFTIGTELTNLNKEILKSPELVDLIDGVREVYSGKILYAHNFGPEGSGNEFRNMTGIWEKLDYIEELLSK